MTNDEHIELFDRLSAVARGSGLDWVVDEVQAAIDEGVEEQVEIELRTKSGGPRKGETRITRRALQPRERIIVLIDAVERVLDDGVRVEMAVASFFAEERELSDEAPTLVQFLPPTDNAVDTDRGFVVGELEELRRRRTAVEALKSQLVEIRSKVAQ